MGLEGVAGAGKTTSLAAVHEAAEQEGYEVRGLAPTSRAAHKLAESGIESETLQRHLRREEQPDEGQKRLYVLDESSLASTKQMNEFLHRLHGEDRVLLVGDKRQHEAVEAGRPYHQLQQAGMQTARLDEIVRQKDPALKEAVEQLARGDVFGAIDNLDRQGRVHEIVGRDERLSEIAREYARRTARHTRDLARQRITPRVEWADPSRNAAARRREPRRAQTARARFAAGDDGSRSPVGGAVRGGRCGALHARQQSAGHRARRVRARGAGGYAREPGHNRARERRASDLRSAPTGRRGGVSRRPSARSREGDRMQFTAPSKDLHVANRELGTIEKVNDAGDVQIRMDSGREVAFNIREHPHLDHGYAVTSHSSQGQTADRVLIHVDTEKSEFLVNNRFAYVSVSRGQYDAQIYTNDRSELARDLSRDLTQRTAIPSQEQEPTAQKIEPAAAQQEAATRNRKPQHQP